MDPWQEFYEPEIETLERPALEALQLERLRWQVARCYENSPFYRERLDRAGVRPEDIRSLADIEKIPVVTKEELRQEQLRHPPFGRYTVAPPQEWRELHPSTGTTGVPVNTIWTQRDVEYIARWTARTLWGFGVRPGDIVQNGFSYGLWVAGLAVHYAAQRLGCLVIPTGATTADRQIDFFLQARPTVFLGTPSFALFVAERMRERGIPPAELSLRLGAFGGEGGIEVPSTREKVEQGLGLEAYDYYGLAEMGPTFAAECREKAGLHWAEDHFLVEVIDPQTMKRCPPGEVGVLVFTHLTKEATPMLRYWSNDYARLVLDRCACGRTHARSPGGILGRHDDMIIYRGAKFYPVQVEKVVRSFKELGDEYLIRLTRDARLGTDEVTVVVEYKDERANTPEFQQRLRQALRDELQVRPRVEVVRPGTLERTTFKAKRIEDRRR